MKNKYLSIFLRYLILILIALPGFSLFYFIFSPLTIFPTAWFLDLFYLVSLNGNMIFVNDMPIEIIGACVAGSAYYFLLILNLSVPKIKVFKRFKMISFAFGLFFLINLIRIISLSFMYVERSTLFDFTHKLFWYLGSTVFVIGIWFLEVWIFRLKKIPIYEDMKFLYKNSLFGKRK